MKTLKPIITAFITGLLLSFVGLAQASIDVKLKTASGFEKLETAGYQQKTVFNLLFHQGKIGFSYDAASGSPVATKSAPYRGGGYGKLDRVAGRERHHMPADSVSPISRHKGSAIQMDKADHALTSSYGSSNAAKAYRNEIGSLSPRDAMAREIRDVRRIGGTKYNQATREMLDYSKQSGYLNK